jgi:hypothetical protein
MAGKVDPQVSKAKTLAKIKKLREHKRHNQVADEAEDDREPSLEEEGEDFLDTYLKITKKYDQGNSKAKVIIRDDDEPSPEKNLQTEETYDQKDEGILEEEPNNGEMQEEEICAQPEESGYKKPKKVKRPYRSFTISVGFPDSVVQKCQVAAVYRVFRVEKFHVVATGQNCVYPDGR